MKLYLSADRTAAIAVIGDRCYASPFSTEQLSEKSIAQMKSFDGCIHIEGNWTKIMPFDRSAIRAVDECGFPVHMDHERNGRDMKFSVI